MPAQHSEPTSADAQAPYPRRVSRLVGMAAGSQTVRLDRRHNTFDTSLPSTTTQQVRARQATVLHTPRMQASPAVATSELWVAAGLHALER